MFTEYKNLPNNSRVWIYQADRIFTAQEVELISTKAIDFIEQWTRHGDDLKGSFTIKYNQFLILAVDESFNDVSGCSIDASVALIKSIASEAEVDFFDRTKICFMTNNEVFDLPMIAIKKNVESGKISADTLTFNNLISTVDDLSENWLVESQNSWLKKYFK